MSYPDNHSFAAQDRFMAQTSSATPLDHVIALGCYLDDMESAAADFATDLAPVVERIDGQMVGGATAAIWLAQINDGLARLRTAVDSATEEARSEDRGDEDYAEWDR